MKRVLSLIIAITFLLTAKSGFSQETKYKALYLYNFTKYIGWPPSSKSGDFVIAILGNSPVYKQLNDIASGRTVGNQKIVVKKINTIEEIQNCHMIFVSSSKASSANMDALVQKLDNKNTLLVTEREKSINKGAVINFVIRNEQMRFELNMNNALNYGLQISSNLEKLAIQT